MAGKQSKGKRFTEKSKRGALFRELCHLYATLWRSALPEPLLTIARARIWRGHPLPDHGNLRAALKPIKQAGIAEHDVKLLICICEVLFRPLRLVEAKLEEGLPEWIPERVTGKPGQGSKQVLLELEFQRLWREMAQREGRAWVLAAGRQPLSIRHRPRLVAPWVVGVVVKQWLQLEKVPQHNALPAALSLVEALLTLPVRPLDVQHWERLLKGVTVPMSEGKRIPLAHYLVNPRRWLPHSENPLEKVPDTGVWTPADYVHAFSLPHWTTHEFSQLLGRAWTAPQRSRPRSLSATPRWKGLALTEPSTFPAEPGMNSEDGESSP